MYKNGKLHSLDSCTLRKILIMQKKASSKSCLELNSLQKSQGRICLSPSRVELGGFKDWCIWNIIMKKNGKVDSLEGSTLPKTLIISKNGSNKSYWALNSLQKSLWERMSICLQSGAKGLQRLICFKYYSVLKWESWFSLGLDAAKNTHYMRKDLQIKVAERWISCKVA